MPAKNPRLTITLDPGIAAQLRRISELTHNSQASLISDLLEGSQEVFARVIQVLEAANDAKEQMRGKVTADLAGAQAKLEGQLGLALETFDEATGDLLKEVEAVKRRARRGAKSAASPALVSGGATPLSNRGVRSTTQKTKKPSKSRG